MKLPMHAVREVLRLATDSTLSNRAIGRMAKLSHNSVRKIRDHLALSGELWEDLRGLGDDALAGRLWLSRKAPVNRKARPQWINVHEQMKQADVTLELLWQEYRESEPEGLSYAQYTRLYREWVKLQKLSMRQIHLPGDKCFVDFCGRTVPITNPATGAQSNAQIFVATLGASGYFFATAVPSQSVADWLMCHKRTLEFFDGVPRYIVPDNLKSAVIKNTREQVVLNRAYAEFSDHYNFTVLPARPRKPKDKSLGEIGVQIVQRFVLARLRSTTFFSYEELNEKIMYWVSELNNRVTRTYPKSRTSQFREIEQPALQGLPEQPYSYSQWVYQVRVGNDYHVALGEHSYSVPYHYASQLVDMRVHGEWLEILHKHKVISSHRVNSERGTSTHLEHLSPSHGHFHDSKPEMLIAWAETIGPQTLIYVRNNLEQRRDFASGLKAVIGIMRDVRRGVIPALRLESASAYANSLNILGSERLRSILRNESDLRTVARKPVLPIEHDNIRGAQYYASQGDEPL
ncbi:IS21 family transposase [Pseudomonas sp. Irchel 3E13]|uniref:IS21 family transposase n=1 Tax=Pseudomonas sp. Irchel 3E13 TaxID=2008975 RepID=UPI000BA469D2|nr:IS21 family transposase [Pseudomonas sp. Irchel 3E13]